MEKKKKQTLKDSQKEGEERKEKNNWLRWARQPQRACCRVQALKLPDFHCKGSISVAKPFPFKTFKIKLGETKIMAG